MSKKDTKLWPITIEGQPENPIRCSAFFHFRDNDRFHFASSTLTDLHNLIEGYTGKKLEVIYEGTKPYFKQR
jgi:hypothetical protein